MSLDDTIIVVTLSLIIFVNWSTITTIAFFSFDFGSSPIILILISCYGPFGVFNR